MDEKTVSGQYNRLGHPISLNQKYLVEQRLERTHAAFSEIDQISSSNDELSL